MLVAVCVIGYCLQAGRRGRPELQKLEQDISAEVKEEKQLDSAMASLASLSTRPSSSCSRPPSARPNSAWSNKSSESLGMNLCFEHFSHLQSLVWLNPVLRGSPQKVTKLGSTPKSGTVMLFSNGGFRPTAIVIGCWLSGPVLLVVWTGIFLLRMDWMSFLVVPSYLMMFKLPDWKLRSSFWLAMILLTVASRDPWRLAFSLSVAIFASPVILDFRLRSWPGFLPFMEKGFKNFTARCELKGLENAQKDRTVFAFHPHGAISFGFTVNGLFDSQFLNKSKKISFLIDDFLRNGNPIFRLLCDVYEFENRQIASAEKSTVHRLMEEGSNVALVLGGFEEATVCETGKDRVVVNSRKGIVKYCLQHGYRLQPVYSFGEDETYHFAPGLLDFRLWLNRFKIPAVAFFGHPVLPWLPRSQARILTVVGEAIQCPHIPSPTPEEVDYWLQSYGKALQATFNQWKAEAGRPQAELEIF
eukprot:symbB.v1.2.010799.t1/scaffold710.1/size170492/10